MAVFRWGHHWEAIGDLEREVDRLLRSVTLSFQGLRFGQQYPAVNLYELEDEYVLTAELPGTSAEDLDLSVSNGVLTLRGSRHDPEHANEECYRRRERPHGSWQRALSVPDRVVEEGVRAELTNGILKVHLPKAPAEKPRQIAVISG
jgi:HSP20 family protein